jgi:Bifunctional DNA primase/polymerase, N-terminal
MRSPQEEAAHRYADHGWFVFPAAPGSKIPATEHGFLDATTSHKQIQRWWRAEPRANVAIATGAPGPDVVDVDKHGDRSGYPAWNKLRQAGLAGEPQAVIRTPSGGMHAYYRGTQQRNGSLPEYALDFRGAGGYVVTAPSKGDGGRPYAVVHKQPSVATFDWGAAREHLDPQPQRQPQRASQRDAGRPRDVGHLAAWVAAQKEGNRNQGLFWAANRAVEAGDTQALGSLAQAARQAGLDEREIDRTIRSAQQTSGSGRPFERQRASAPRPAADRPGREQAPEGRIGPRQGERQHATARAAMPSPRADIERATAAGIAAARAHKHPERELEPGA